MDGRDLAKMDPAFSVSQIVSALSLLTGEYGTLPVLVAVKNWVRFVERRIDADAAFDAVQQSSRNGTC